MICALGIAVLTPSILAAQPASLLAHLTGGKLNLSDLSWAAPLYAHDPQQHSQWADAMRWVAQRKRDQTARMQQQLLAAGVRNVHLAIGCYDDDTCQVLSRVDAAAARFGSLETLEAAARDIAPYVDGFVAAASTVERELNADPKPTLAARLHAAATADQILRIGLTASEYAKLHSPPMVPQAQDFLELRTIIEMDRMDQLHTRWLKEVVAIQGWPRASVLGDTAAYDAWLLAQHADLDPAFQFQALQRMVPLTKRGDADRKRYAYLYDRIMLKITGRQRYGTQAMCLKGQIAPQPLESASLVDQYRREVGLPSLQKYLIRFHEAAYCDPAGVLRPKSHP